MKTKTKFMAVIMAVLMLTCLLPTAAFAAEAPGTERVPISAWTGGTITINASHGDDSFALYKVVDITYDSETNDVTYAFTPAAAAYALAKGVTIDTYKGYDAYGEEVKTFLGGFAAYVKNAENNVTPTTNTTASNNTAAFTGLAMGQYLVLGTGSTTGTYVYQPMTATFAPDAELKINTSVTLNSKSSAPTITKKIKLADGTLVDKKDVAVGEVVEYQLTATVPTYPAGATNKTFTITDTLPAGLSYVADSASQTPTIDGQKLTWEIDLDTYTESTVTITYQATVTEDILATHSAVNDAELTYGYDPYGTTDKTISNSTTVYTYGIEIEKVDADETTKKLAGVAFNVYKGSSEADAVEANLVGTITTGTDGIVKLDGLALGTYYIKETKAATGYVLPAEGVTVTLTDADLNGVLDSEGVDGDAVLNQQITNTKGSYTLPQTGGMGTWMFTIGGVVLMAGAVVLLVFARKKKNV